MSKDIKLDLKSLEALPKKFSSKAGRHASFAGVMLVLLVYLFVVWRISQLATAEPPEDTTVLIQTSIPKVDKKAIDQIQTLEQNNTEVHSLFNNARNNPFQE